MHATIFMLVEEQSRLNLNCSSLESGLSFLHMNIYGTPYLPNGIHFHYLCWFFIICGGYIIICDDLFIIFGT